MKGAMSAAHMLMPPVAASFTCMPGILAAAARTQEKEGGDNKD